MKKWAFLLMLCMQNLNSQNTANSLFFDLDYGIGNTLKSNPYFPERKNTQSLSFSIGKFNEENPNSWAKQLNFPQTGVQFSYTDYGNPDKLGHSYSVLPFINWPLFPGNTNRLFLKTALGLSYFNVIYDYDTNLYNKGISTPVVWNFRSSIRYSFLKKEHYNIGLSLEYCHNSNGHLRLPNHGLNTFMAGVTSQFHADKKQFIAHDSVKIVANYPKMNFLDFRFGYGKNVLSLQSEEKKEVYVLAVNYGKIIKNCHKFGLGLNYHFYQKYYDYINENGPLVHNLYPELKENSFWKSSCFTLTANYEMLLSHVGVGFELGYNVYKPAYKIDWRLNEIKDFVGNPEVGEFNTKNNLKKAIASSLGLKYYVLNTAKFQKHNYYVGIFINANLGQADYNDVRFGYVYTANKKRKAK